jgi:hypothetical protein
MPQSKGTIRHACIKPLQLKPLNSKTRDHRDASETRGCWDTELFASFLPFMSLKTARPILENGFG